MEYCFDVVSKCAKLCILCVCFDTINAFVSYHQYLFAVI